MFLWPLSNTSVVWGSSPVGWLKSSFLKSKTLVVLRVAILFQWLFPQWGEFNVINLLPSSWLVPLGNDATSGLSLAPCCQQIGHSAVTVARSYWWRKSILSSPCIASILATMDTLCVSLLSKPQGGWGRWGGVWLTFTEWSLLSSWCLTPSSVGALGWAFT